MNITHIKDFIGGVDLTQSGHLLDIATQLELQTPKQLTIKQLPLPKKVVLSLGQQLGSCAKPLVAVGDKVLTGQLIAHDPNNNHTGFCTPIHASISGVVSWVDKPLNHPSGSTIPAIVIESDGLDTAINTQGCGDDFSQCSPDKLIDYIHQCGIVGLGGAGFPTHIKLARLQDCHTLIINAVECEVGVCCDKAVMQNHCRAVITGIHILSHIIQPKRIVIALEQGDEITPVMQAVLTNEPTIELVYMPRKYAAGDEKILTKIITGVAVPKGKYGVDVGVLCHNVGTIKAIYEAVINKQPLITRTITLNGTALNALGLATQNYQVRLGLQLEELLHTINIQHLSEYESQLDFHTGGLMMGEKINTLSHEIKKTSSSIFINHKQASNVEQSCIRCGQCHSACPIGLLPQQLYWQTKTQQVDKAVALNLLSCTGCNCCTVVCPSHIPLTDYFSYGKALYKRQQADKKHSDTARERFEFREMRLVRNAGEKKELMAQKKLKLQKKIAQDAKDKGNQSDKIQAALERVQKKQANNEHSVN